MRKFIVATVLLVASQWTAWAQSTTLAGRITGLPDSVETVELNLDSYALLSSLEKHPVSLDAEGYFSITLDLQAPARAFFLLGNVPVRETFTIHTPEGLDSTMSISTNDPRLIYLYLTPGDQQHMEVDAEGIKETLAFRGDGANNSLYLNRDAWAYDAYKHRYLRNYYLNTNYVPDAFKHVVDTRVADRMGFLEDFHARWPLSQHLLDVYRRDIVTEGVTAKLYYPDRRKMYLELDSVALPEDYYGFLDSVNFQSETPDKGIAYFYFLDAYLRNAHRLRQSDTPFYDFIEQQLDGRLHYEYLAFKLGSDFREETYGPFNQRNPYPDLTAAVLEKYQHLEGMLPGRRAPNIAVTTLDDGHFKLRKFRGKYVYIDLWATWCGPCIQEIPSLQQLEKDYEGKNIVFLSLSIDQTGDFQKWKDFVAEYPLHGHQYWLDAENKEVLTRHFNVKQIPRFILLDPRARVIDANAPRPSTPEVRRLLDGVL